MSAARLEMFGLEGLPAVEPGHCLAELIRKALDRQGEQLQPDDIVVVAQKIVSKSEGRQIDLTGIKASAEAVELAGRCEKDPRLVEVILGESSEVLRVLPGALIVVHRNGWIMANAGVDQSNIAGNEDGTQALLLPMDADGSAAELRHSLVQAQGADVGVIINDSFGRPWRQGTVGVALGVAGWPALIDRRGQTDLYGRVLSHTIVGHADEIAAAASILQGQGGEGCPVVIVRGLKPVAANGCGQHMLRPAHMDLFR